MPIYIMWVCVCLFIYTYINISLSLCIYTFLSISTYNVDIYFSLSIYNTDTYIETEEYANGTKCYQSVNISETYMFIVVFFQIFFKIKCLPCNWFRVEHLAWLQAPCLCLFCVDYLFFFLPFSPTKFVHFPPIMRSSHDC